MTPMDRHMLMDVCADIEALYNARGGRNFTPEEQRRYDSLIVMEQLILSPG